MREGVEYKRLKDVCQKASSNIVLNKIADNVGDYPLYGASGFVKNVDFFHQDVPYIGIIKDGAGVGRVGRYPAKSSLVGTMQYILVNEQVASLDYVFYVLQSLHLDKCVTGATIPHIYFRDYGECIIPVPSLSNQQAVVSELDNITAIIADKRQQLKELDNLAQAIFYDMFGDGSSWEKTTLPNVCSSIIRGPFGSALKKEFFVEKSDSTYKVYEQKHAIQKDCSIGTYYISQSKFEELKRFEVFPLDIIMSCSGTIGELYIIPEGAEKGVMNQALLKFHLNDKITSNFFLFIMDYVKKRMTIQGCGLQNIGSVKEISQIEFPFPPMALQKEFDLKIQLIESQKADLAKSIQEFENLLAQRMEYHFA